MNVFVGATFCPISRQIVPKLPTLIFVQASISPRLLNEVLCAGFDCQNAYGSVNLPNCGSHESDDFQVDFWTFFLKM